LLQDINPRTQEQIQELFGYSVQDNLVIHCCKFSELATELVPKPIQSAIPSPLSRCSHTLVL
jgi:hypothetical protein